MNRAAIRSAAAWYAQLCAEDCSADEQRACAQWRAADPDHEQAWQQVQALRGRWQALPRQLSAAMLRDVDAQPNRQRRAVLRGLGAAGVGSAALWLSATRLPWRHWSAEHRTAAGEQRELRLADGTQLWLNTATAVDVHFDAQRRLLRLHAGEIYVETAPDPAAQARPFVVDTPQGRLRALGTRFSVRSDDTQTRLVVLQHAVAVQPADLARQIVIEAGTQLRFTRGRLDAPQAADDSEAAWTRGLLVVSGWTLAQLLEELARYQSGRLICAPAVADLRVSGAFPVRPLDVAFTALTQTLPVQIRRQTRWNGVQETRVEAVAAR